MPHLFELMADIERLPPPDQLRLAAALLEEAAQTNDEARSLAMFRTAKMLAERIATELGALEVLRG